ncbi:hypothetical protein [Glutamicibacter sp.]|uniref:hypothetical protein n=1 Tax=Glutamicibacter sp. TaxID=1931995 RepID=UPI0028BDE0B6|nr:hypothetical protein [Glutamicibacter sp.]
MTLNQCGRLLWSAHESSQQDSRAAATAMLSTLGAAVLFFLSCNNQLQAAHTRWIRYGSGYEPGGLSIEDSRFDYYLPQPPVILLPDTSLPFGIGMLLQALGLLLLLLCLLHLRPRSAVRARRIQRLCGLLAAASSALLGIEAVVTGLNATLFDRFSTHWAAIPVLALAGPALLVLGVFAWWRMPSLAIALMCSMSTSIIGYLASALLIAPLVTGHDSFDAVPGTETIVALGTGAAAAACLLTALSLLRQEFLRSCPPTLLR